MLDKYGSFTKEFKLEILRLADETELPIAQFARNLGIRRNMILDYPHFSRHLLSSKNILS